MALGHIGAPSFGLPSLARLELGTVGHSARRYRTTSLMLLYTAALPRIYRRELRTVTLYSINLAELMNLQAEVIWHTCYGIHVSINRWASVVRDTFCYAYTYSEKGSRLCYSSCPSID